MIKKKWGWLTSALLVLSACLLYSQEFRGTLTGHVSDPSGASVPGADVTAVNDATAQTYNAKAGNSGDYVIPYILPGTYTVSVASQGFKTAQFEKVVIQSGKSPVLDVNLQLGPTADKVTVTDEAPLLEAENAVQNNILQQRELENVPLNGRQVFTLLGTTPGSQSLQTQFGSQGASGTRAWDNTDYYVVGGGVQRYQQFTLNGANITNQNNGTGQWFISPNIDAIQEVNIQSTNYDARFGRSSGGFMNMVIKQGANQYRGDVYDFFQNTVLNANNFQNNLNGVPRQGTQQNQFGGVFGGPIIKDKVFFFGSMEGYVQNIYFSTVTSVPPAYLRPQNGAGVNFTPSGYTIYDPQSTFCSNGTPLTDCTGTLQRVPFANNTIPANRISPAGAALLNLFPSPNTNVTSAQNNFIANTPARYRYWQPMARVDYDTSDKTRWYSLFAFQHGTEFRNSSGFPPPAQNGNINWQKQFVMGIQDMTHIFSPTLVMDAKLTFSRFQDRFPNGDLSSTVTPQSIGLNMPLVPTSTRRLLPEVNFTEVYPQLIGNNLSSDVYNNYIFDIDFTKTIGKHTIHFGGEAAYYQWGTPDSVGRPNGFFQFGTQFTQANPYQRGTVDGQTDGNVLADLLLGAPDGVSTGPNTNRGSGGLNNSTSGIDYNISQWTHFPTTAFYAQDAWHVTPKLTLNIGLRYDVQFGLRGHGLNRGLCLTTCVNPITNDPAYQANLTAAAPALAATGIINVNSLRTLYGGVLFAGQNGEPADAFDTDYSNIGPRFGFAYQVTPKTVIRGGYGIMYAVGLEGGTTVGYSQTTPYTASLDNNLTPSGYFASGNPYPNGYVTPLGAAGGLLTGVGNGASYDFPGRRIPRSQEASFGIQQELPGNTVLDVRVVGNWNNRLRTTGYAGAQGSVWLNAAWTKQTQEAAQANPNLFNSSVPNPFFGIPSVPAGTTLGSSPTIPAYYLTLPYPQFPGPLGQYNMPLGRSQYQALEVLLTKRLSSGVSLRAAYTFSKTMQATGFLNGWPYQDPQLLRQISPYDRTHIFALSGVYNLPSLASGSGWRNITGALINHWTLSNILTVQSGQPQYLPGGFYYTSNHSWTPDGGPSISQWIYNCGGNPLNCWTPVPPFGLNNLPNQIGSLRQPQVPNLDLSVQRDFPIRERWRLQFRADAFNVTNSVLFGGPDTNPYDGPPVRQADGSWRGFGTIAPYQNNFPRIVQLSLKLFF